MKLTQEAMKLKLKLTRGIRCFYTTLTESLSPDPTKGFVTHVNKGTTLNAGLAKLIDGKVEKNIP